MARRIPLADPQRAYKMPRRLPRKQTTANHADALGDALAGLSGSARVITFIERFLKHDKGEMAGKPLLLLDSQKEIIRGLYDPKDAAARRLIRAALAFIPRKGGKSTFAAALAVYETFDRGPGASVVVAANSRDQASLLFLAAANMIEQCPELKARAATSRAQKRIVDRVTRSSFRAISSDSPTAHGLDLTCFIYDELHAAPNRELYDVLATSTGARAEALGLVISTAGFDKQSILGELYDHAKRVQHDPTLDPSFYAFIAEAEEGDAWDDERTWFKANPALGIFRDLSEMRQLAARAKQIPAQIDAFKRLYLNIWTASSGAWLSLAAWDDCGNSAVTDAELQGATAYAGLDLSSTTDLTSLAIAFLLPDERVAVLTWNFIPGANLRDRELRDRAPYGRWIAEGRVEVAGAEVIDTRIVAARVLEECARWNVRFLCFDRWGSNAVIQTFTDAGLEVVQHGQGFRDMNAPTKHLEELVLTRRLAHGACPLLRWAASCVTVATDPAGNIKPVKPDRLSYTKRIDPIVALVMCLAPLMANKPKDLSNLFADFCAV
jgi:phage terminase large subunit-like protein